MDIKDIQLRNKIKNLMNSLDENDYYKLIYQIGFNDLLNPYGLFGSICVNKLIKKYGSEILKSKININTFPIFCVIDTEFESRRSSHKTSAVLIGDNYHIKGHKAYSSGISHAEYGILTAVMQKQMNWLYL